jgi:hypothetical protein
MSDKKLVYEGWVSLKVQNSTEEKSRRMWSVSSVVNIFKRRWVVLFVAHDAHELAGLLQAYKDESKTSSLKAEISLNECSLIRQAKDNVIWSTIMDFIVVIHHHVLRIRYKRSIPFIFVFIQKDLFGLMIQACMYRHP